MENIKIEKVNGNFGNYYLLINNVKETLALTASELLTLSKMIKDMRTELEMERMK